MKRTLLGLAPFILAVLLATTAHAQTGNWYLTPSAAYTNDDGDRNIDDSLAGGQITVGRAVSDHFSLEGMLGYSDIKGFPDQEHLEASFNALVITSRDNAVSPYLLFGVGYLAVTFPNGFEDNRTTGSVGIGLTWALGGGSVSLRAEHRARVAYESDNNLVDQISTLGLQFSFGRKATVSLDSDMDGVVDGSDQCPNTARGARVDSTGCRPVRDGDGDGVPDHTDACLNTVAGASVDSFGCRLDSDRDGVSDDMDQCPNTVAGAAVDAKGCGRDSDGDNVGDHFDRCPNTPAGARVDVYGCQIREVIELPGVNFASGTDRVLAGAEQILTDAAATLKMHPDLVIEVAGHTDTDGARLDNQGLSERRASTVRDFLINAGVDAARLTVRGYGEMRLIADDTTPQGKAANRRVELRILSR